MLARLMPADRFAARRAKPLGAGDLGRRRHGQRPQRLDQQPVLLDQHTRRQRLGVVTWQHLDPSLRKVADELRVTSVEQPA